MMETARSRKPEGTGQWRIRTEAESVLMGDGQPRDPRTSRHHRATRSGLSAVTEPQPQKQSLFKNPELPVKQEVTV